MMCVLDWWCSEWWHHNLYEYMKMDWSNECVVIDEWWFQYEVCLFEFLFVWEWIEMIVIDCTPIPYSSTQTIQHISFYIQSLWFEYELYVISDNPSFNISCFHHCSIPYIIHTIHQHLLFTSTHSLWGIVLWRMDKW